MKVYFTLICYSDEHYEWDATLTENGYWLAVAHGKTKEEAEEKVWASYRERYETNVVHMDEA